MTEFKIADQWLRRMIYIVGIMGIIAFSFYTFSLLKSALGVVGSALMPFLMGLLLAYIFSPVVISLQKRLRLGRIIGTLALFAIVFLVVFLLLAFLIPTLVDQIIGLFQALKEAIPTLLKRLSEYSSLHRSSGFIQNLMEKIGKIDVQYEDIVAYLLPGLKKMASGGFATVGKATREFFSWFSTIAGYASFLTFVGIITFYFIVDWENIRPLIRKMIPPAHRERVFDVLEKIDIAVGGFLRGQLTVSLIVGGLFATGLFGVSFMGFPALRNFSILIGTAAAIGGFIPYLGPIIGVTPAILIVLLTAGIDWGTKSIALLATIGIFAVIQAIEGFVLQPRIVGKGAGLHPLAVMFALLFGAQFGIGGMIVAVPLASIIRVLVREFYWLPIERHEAALDQNEATKA